MAILIAAILTLSMTASIILQPTVNAHTPPWTVVSYAYMIVAPNPVGVGQTVAVVMWIDCPLPGAVLGNGIRRANYMLTITKPDGKVSTQTWENITDPTGLQYYQYTPDQVGNYTLKFSYPGQNYTWTSSTSGANTIYTGDIFLAASKTTTLTVQQEPIPAAIDSYPLPTNYWTYPIEGQNTNWYTIASNWLGVPYIVGAVVSSANPGAYQPDGSAPNSAHIMWTKPIQYGGLVGGNDTAVPGEMWYGGLSYNPRFNNPIIMQGTLFYQEPFGNSGSGGYLVAVDLQTGQELWRVNASATGVSLVPSFGYIYTLENPNQHGSLSNGLLVASTTSYPGLGTVWKGYDPRTGVLTTMNVTNVPGGTAVAGPSGEYLIYAVTNLGTTTNPKWYLSQWNSSDVFGNIFGLVATSPSGWYSGTENASLPSCYDWNISLPTLSGTGWSIVSAARGAVPLVSLGNMMLLVQGTFGGHAGEGLGATPISTDPANITAISLRPGTIGQVLWTKTYQPAPGNNTRMIVCWDPSNGVFVFGDKESFTFYGYSLADGSQLWGPTVLTNDFTSDYNYMYVSLENIAYGKMYHYGYSGILGCYDDKTGNLLWTYGNGGEGNSTLSGLQTAYGRYPIFLGTIADGKVYLVSVEHSPNSPLYKGAELRCINATDGTEIWAIMNWGNQISGAEVAVASGYLTTLNSYDAQIYCYGMGPSQTTVTAPDVGVTTATPITIRGTVMDISAGTKQNQQAADFPNGVPCASDDSESAWMEYVYMQKPMPTNATGVPVTLSVIDSNGNYRQIGNTTTDASGTYSFSWTPDIPGKYTVIATFAGSNSYWGSSAESAFTASAAPATASPYPVVNLPPTEMYFTISTVAIIIAIAIVGAVLALLMLRKRP
jgi:hypothetical protein